VARSVRTHGHPVPAPALLLSGGETTVTIRPGTPEGGRGGRNSESLLGFVLAAAGLEDCWALMADTDGIDGSESNAGAVAGPDTLRRAAAAGLDARALLAAHNSHALFDRLGDTIVTGPTLTNVNDFRAILIA
jgi:glycerate 2-kinase